MVADVQAVVTATITAAGVGLGAAIRRPGAAAAATVALYLGVSGLLGSAPGLNWWNAHGLAAAQTVATVPTGAHAYPFLIAVLVNVGVTVLIVAVGAALTRRADLR